jgi:predicted DNA-binding transcriptional regulator AlpA
MRLTPTDTREATHAPDLEPATLEATDAPPGCYDALARLPESALVDEAGMAQAFHVAGRTIRRMGERHELPPPVRFAGRAVWIVGKVHRWLAEAAERQEANARKHLEKIRRMGA